MKDRTKINPGHLVCLYGLVTVAVTLIPDLAQAVIIVQPDSGISQVLCLAARAIRGNAGRGAGTIAVAALGIAAAYGKVSWGVAAMGCAGMAAIFGATTILFPLQIMAGPPQVFTCP